MKAIKVSEATPTQLDWLVAKCEGYVWAPVVRPSRCFDCHHYEERQGRDDAIQYCHHPDMDFEDGSVGDSWSSYYECHKKCPYKEETQKPAYPAYSTDWDQGGPIIARKDMEFDHETTDGFGRVIPCTFGDFTRACIPEADGSEMPFYAKGSTHLIAAMRCYVISELGETVEVPDELT